MISNSWICNFSLTTKIFKIAHLTRSQPTYAHATKLSFIYTSHYSPYPLSGRLKILHTKHPYRTALQIYLYTTNTLLQCLCCMCTMCTRYFPFTSAARNSSGTTLMIQHQTLQTSTKSYIMMYKTDAKSLGRLLWDTARKLRA